MQRVRKMFYLVTPWHLIKLFLEDLKKKTDEINMIIKVHS